MSGSGPAGGGWPGHAVLQVPVPELEPFVRARTRHHDPTYLAADPAHVHAHVTALGPFLADPDEAALVRVAAVVASVRTFGFTLARLGTFADGIVHLVPEPDRAFRDLTARLAAAFPQCPPYGGRFGSVADVQPHLTLDLVGAGITEESTRSALGDHGVVLPVRCRAERVDLAWYEPGACGTRTSWPLG